MHAIPNVFKEEKKHPGQVLTSVTAEPKGLRVPCLAHFTPLLKPAVLPSNKERFFQSMCSSFRELHSKMNCLYILCPLKIPLLPTQGLQPIPSMV